MIKLMFKIKKSAQYKKREIKTLIILIQQKKSMIFLKKEKVQHLIDSKNKKQLKIILASSVHKEDYQNILMILFSEDI